MAHLIKLYYQRKESDIGRAPSWIGSILYNWKEINEKSSYRDFQLLTENNILAINRNVIDMVFKDTRISIEKVNIRVITNFFGDYINFTDMNYIRSYITDYINNDDITKVFLEKYNSCRKPKKFTIRN